MYFESATIKHDCPMQMHIMKYLKIYNRLLVYFAIFTVCSGDIKF